MNKISNFIKNYSWAKIFIIFVSLSFLLRCALLFIQRSDIDFAPLVLIQTFLLGFIFDLATFLYISLVPILYYTLIGKKFFNSKTHQKVNCALYFGLLFALIFGFFAEIIFWDEFQARFNFIAVDYLIYTTEVIGNIIESYPLVKILSVIFILAALIFYPTYKKIITIKEDNLSKKLIKFAVLLTLTLAAFFVIDSGKFTKHFTNKYLAEISENGVYQLFSAYRNNEINYHQLYKSMPEEDSLQELRKAISKQERSSKFLDNDSIARFVFAPKGSLEKKYNVMFVTIESFSADFMKSFGNEENITPNMDKFAKEGLFFSNLYATGTRTVRGLEALSLSIPPTPGNSIVRRLENENLFNISSPLNDRGYESKFIYGGFGYFDNMNYFFGNNGFKIVDREKFAKEEITFSNVWGVSDEDLFSKAIKEADDSYKSHKPFLNFIMTTSNHRPFTYPDGKIDIKSKTGRSGAVKYTDYAIGKLIENSKNKPWFNNTIFVFVADHCAGSAGNTDVPMWRYQIPAIFYAPKIIKPQKFDVLTSQIDIAPTLLGVMNLSYKSKFFGVDVLNNRKNLDQHVFVGTYADVGYFKKNKLYVLKPKKEVKIFDVELIKRGWNGSKEVATKDFSDEELKEAIAYYQTASYLFKENKLKNFNANHAKK